MVSLERSVSFFNYDYRSFEKDAYLFNKKVGHHEKMIQSFLEKIQISLVTLKKTFIEPSFAKT